MAYACFMVYSVLGFMIGLWCRIGFWFMIGLWLVPGLKFRHWSGFMIGSGRMRELKFTHGLGFIPGLGVMHGLGFMPGSGIMLGLGFRLPGSLYSAWACRSGKWGKLPLVPGQFQNISRIPTNT